MNKKIIGILICMLLIAAAVPAVECLKNSGINTTVPSAPLRSMAANWTEMQKLLASDSAGWSYFGTSVSVDGDTALIGAPTEYETSTGSAYVFTHTGTTWSQQAKLLSSDGAINDYFGVSVSLAGDTALIGACGDDDNGGGSGSAYVFIRTGTIWTQQQKLLASDGAAGDRFGISVFLDGVYALIGADGGDNNQYFTGAAYVYKRDGTHWTQEAKLLASDGTVDDNFGTSVSLDGDYALIGSVADDDQGSDSGSAYVFKRDGTNWAQEAKLLASDGAGNDNFGRCVSLDGEYAIISAPTDSDNGAWSGSVYMFTRTGTTWSQQAKLLASDGGANDCFGTSVSVDGDTALIGAWFDDDNGYDSGSAYVFTRTGTTWTQQKKFLASDGAAGDWFGFAVSLDSDTALIGAYGDDDNGADSGSAFIFTKNQPPVANFTYNPFSPTELAVIQFNDTSTDADGTITSWSWDFGDGSTSTLQNPTHNYTDDGTYSVMLTVTDNNGSSDSISKNIVVSNPPLIADAGGPYYGNANSDICFNGSAVGGEPPYYFSWDLDNDGEFDDAFGDVAHYSWDVPGVYNISLKVRDIYWQYSINTTEVAVGNTAPNKPDQPTGQLYGNPGREYLYSTTTIDPDGDQVNYLWDWGDGNNSNWTGLYNSGVIASRSHEWAAKGTYSIKVKAKDINGAESPWSDPLPITMPYTYNSMHQFFEWLFQRFPNAFPILRHLLGY